MEWPLFTSILKSFLNQHRLMSNPIAGTLISCSQIFHLSPKACILHTSLSLSHKTHVQNPVTCARKRKTPAESRKLGKTLSKVAIIMVLNLKILPEPWGLVIREFSGGDGRGGGRGGGCLRFLKGLGGGGFDGWGRKGKKKLGFVGFLCACGLLVLVLVLVLIGSGFKSDVVYGVLAFGFSGAVLINGCKIRVKDWILGVLVLGGLLGFRLKRGDMQRWIENVKTSSSVVDLVKSKRRRNSKRVL